MKTIFDFFNLVSWKKLLDFSKGISNNMFQAFPIFFVVLHSSEHYSNRDDIYVIKKNSYLCLGCFKLNSISCSGMKNHSCLILVFSLYLRPSLHSCSLWLWGKEMFAPLLLSCCLSWWHSSFFNLSSCLLFY